MQILPPHKITSLFVKYKIYLLYIIYNIYFKATQHVACYFSKCWLKFLVIRLFVTPKNRKSSNAWNWMRGGLLSEIKSKDTIFLYIEVVRHLFLFFCSYSTTGPPPNSYLWKLLRDKRKYSSRFPSYVCVNWSHTPIPFPHRHCRQTQQGNCKSNSRKCYILWILLSKTNHIVFMNVRICFYDKH